MSDEGRGGGREEELAVRLEEVGLTEYEARTLIALVRLGTGTARDVADLGPVPRTRVYDAAETLHEMGLVDVQYSTPRRYAVISTESIVRRLDNRRRRTLSEIGVLFEALDTAQPTTERLGAWTITGRASVKQRVLEFVDEADEEVVYLTVDELLTEDHLDTLREADRRGVDAYVGGVSGTVRTRIEEAVPSVTTFETLWEWSDTPVGSLLVTDGRTALVSVRVEKDGEELDEVAIWGSGERNSLVVVLRSMFTWQLESYGRTSDEAEDDHDDDEDDEDDDHDEDDDDDDEDDDHDDDHDDGE